MARLREKSLEEIWGRQMAAKRRRQRQSGKIKIQYYRSAIGFNVQQKLDREGARVRKAERDSRSRRHACRFGEWSQKCRIWCGSWSKRKWS